MRCPRCMSLAMRAAPLAVWVPATAQLLLPPPSALDPAPPTADEALLSRTLSVAASGTLAVALAPDVTPAGASQLVSAGYRKPSAHFQPAAHAGPPSRVLISWRSISRYSPFTC